MPTQYPYVASPGPLLRTIEHLRRSFPKEVTAETLRKLGAAPKNETYVINVLRFLGLIDAEGKKIGATTTAFLKQDDGFKQEFEKIVKDSYGELFELYGERAWTLERSDLTQFFRTADHSTEVVGSRQAGTFITLAGLSGHGDVPSVKDTGVSKKEKKVITKKVETDKKTKKTDADANSSSSGKTRSQNFGLTVRVEVNLPSDGDQQTYDRIFQSIRKNLIDGE